LRGLLVVGGIVALLLLVYWLKNRPEEPIVQPLPTAAATAEAVVTLPALPTAQASIESQIQAYLDAHQPMLVFFHSQTCHSCQVMVERVAQVYPDFDDRVALVDVDVYAPQNQNLVMRAQIRSIPTMVFVTRDGEGQAFIGPMEVSDLTEQLQRIAGAE
jgi:thioredoxin-like negative regulator of GroEL